MMRYRRDVPPPGDTTALVAAAAHIRAHLSAVADPDDDPKRFASRVQIDVDPRLDTGLITLVGILDVKPPRGAQLPRRELQLMSPEPGPEDHEHETPENLAEAARLLAARTPGDGWDDMHDPDGDDAGWLTDKDVE